MRKSTAAGFHRRDRRTRRDRKLYLKGGAGVSGFSPGGQMQPPQWKFHVPVKPVGSATGCVGRVGCTWKRQFASGSLPEQDTGTQIVR